MGRVDVDALLDEMTPEQMDGWDAAYRVEREWWAMLAQHVIAHIVRANGHDVEIESFDYLRTLDFERE